MPGRRKDKNSYLSDMNESDFVFLVADILSVHFHHLAVKIMDGTGDGKRDIFSINPDYDKCITQCKFHYDFNKTCGSSETDEIILALHKFGCKAGFFCTSGKLSPQAKREYLDNYPDFNLGWLEGHEIIDIVLGNPMLKEIWIEKLHLANKTVIIPFLMRRLPEDINHELTLEQIEKIQASIPYPFIKIFASPEQFFPYRSLDAKKTNRFYGNLYVESISLIGNTSFTHINNVKKEILQHLSQNLTLSAPEDYLALRFGIPYFNQASEPEYRKSVPKFNLPIRSETFILQNQDIKEEYDWLIDLSEEWKRPDRIHMSQLRYFCFYNHKHDIVLHFYYKSKVDSNRYPEIENRIEAEKLYWSKSLFISIETSELPSFLTDLGDHIPTVTYDYGPLAKLLCWFQPRLMVRSMDLELFEQELEDPEFKKVTDRVAAIALRRKLEIIPWEQATKIAALYIDDPFPMQPEMTFNIVDINETFDTIFSPILPSKREIIFECVWYLSNKNDEQTNKRIDKLTNELSVFDANLIFTLDDDTAMDLFLKLEYGVLYQPHQSTNDICETALPAAVSFFEDVTRVLLMVFPDSEIVTNKYWYQEFGVTLHRE
jgi:hypothetical protein